MTIDPVKNGRTKATLSFGNWLGLVSLTITIVGSIACGLWALSYQIGMLEGAVNSNTRGITSVKETLKTIKADVRENRQEINQVERELLKR